MTELGKSMTTFVTQSGKSGTTNKLKPTEAKLYKLAGWCQVARISQIPGVWLEIFKAAGYTDQAAALNRVVTDKMKKTNEIVSRSTLNRQEEFMKAIVSVEAPQEELTFDNRNEGWGLHNYLPRSEEQQQNDLDDEVARRLSRGNWDYDLALRLRKISKNKTIFTTDLLCLEQALIDYCADLSELLTVNCPHYIWVWEIRRTINTYRGSPRLKKIFTQGTIVIIQWVVFDDFRQYRQTVLTRADFNSTNGRVEWPRSHLESFVRRLQDEVVIAPLSLPQQLRNLGIGKQAEEGLSQGGSIIPTGGGLWTPPPNLPTAPAQLKGGEDPLRVTGWHNHVHPEIATVMNPLRSLMQEKLQDGGYPSMTKLLELEGKTIKEHCPKTDAAKDTDGRRGLCWNFTLGRCPRGQSCRHVHAPPSAIPKKIVSEVVPVITPGIGKTIENLKPMQSKKRAKKGSARRAAGPTVSFS
jgi:hypothetical protein